MTSDAAETDSKEIMVYTLSTCSHCKDVKKLLTAHGVDYDSLEVDLLEGDERKTVIEEIRGHNPKVTFPTTIIDGEVVVGNKEDRIKELLNRRQEGTGG